MKDLKKIANLPYQNSNIFRKKQHHLAMALIIQCILK
jgi:hypothetical protein